MTKSKKRTHVSFSEMYISFWLRIDYIIKKLKSSSFACIFPDNENCRVIFVAEIIGPVSSLAISTAAESSSRFLFSLSHHESCLSLTQLHMDYASHHWHMLRGCRSLVLVANILLHSAFRWNYAHLYRIWQQLLPYAYYMCRWFRMSGDIVIYYPLTKDKVVRPE